jgi:hypothetical protein
MRLFVAGDTHGATEFITDYLYPKAAALHADAIVQCGDFGFWEHFPDGIDFLDEVQETGHRYRIPLYALHGNHDNWSTVMANHGHTRDEDWFVRVREHIRYIPQGHIWTWAGYRMRAFGGAYSVDKLYRLDVERSRWRQAAAREDARRAAGLTPQPVLSTAGTLWFPDEQMTDEEFAELMIIDAQPVDVVFSHDKPRAANPGPGFTDLAECVPNQDRLQLALEVLHPAWWFHGHLHINYQDTVPCGPPHDTHTTVVGLSCDNVAGAGDRFWKPWHAWCLLDLTPTGPVVTTARDADESLDNA